MYLLRFYCTTAQHVAQSLLAAHSMGQHSKKGGSGMRRKKGDPFSGRPHSGLGWVLLLAALALFLLAGAPGCMAQRMAWSARGTMIFLPSGF